MEPSLRDPLLFVGLASWIGTVGFALAVAAVAYGGSLVARGALGLRRLAARWLDPRFARPAHTGLPTEADFDAIATVRGLWRTGEAPRLVVDGQAVTVVGEVEVVDGARGDGSVRDGDAVLAVGTLRRATGAVEEAHYRGAAVRWELVAECGPVRVRAATVDPRGRASRLARWTAGALAAAAFCVTAERTARSALRAMPTLTDVTIRCDARGVTRSRRWAPEARVWLERVRLVPWHREAADRLLAGEGEVSDALAPTDLAGIESAASASERRGEEACAQRLRDHVRRTRAAQEEHLRREAARHAALVSWSALVDAFERGALPEAWLHTCLLNASSDLRSACAAGPLSRREVLAEVPLAQPSAARTSLACVVHARETFGASGEEWSSTLGALSRQGTPACRFAAVVLDIDDDPVRADAALARLAQDASPWPDLARGARLMLRVALAVDDDPRTLPVRRDPGADPGAWFYRHSPASLLTVLEHLQSSERAGEFARLGPGAVGAALAHRGGDVGSAWGAAVHCARVSRSAGRDIVGFGETLAACSGVWELTVGSLLAIHPLAAAPPARWRPRAEVDETAEEPLTWGLSARNELLRLALDALAEAPR